LSNCAYVLVTSAPSSLSRKIGSAMVPS
jgi:hypothetical protein